MKKVTLATISQKVKKIATAQQKVENSIKELAQIVFELAKMNYDKKQIRQKLTDEFEKNGFSPKYIKKIRGFLMAIYDGVEKNPTLQNEFEEKLQKATSQNEIEKIARAFKKGSFELNIKKEEENKKEKSEEDEIIKVIKKYIKVSNIKKLSEDKIQALFEEALKIQKLLTE